jgi:hypothetical protein
MFQLNISASTFEEKSVEKLRLQSMILHALQKYEAHRATTLYVILYYWLVLWPKSSLQGLLVQQFPGLLVQLYSS